MGNPFQVPRTAKAIARYSTLEVAIPPSWGRTDLYPRWDEVHDLMNDPVVFTFPYIIISAIA